MLPVNKPLRLYLERLHAQFSADQITTIHAVRQRSSAACRWQRIATPRALLYMPGIGNNSALTARDMPRGASLLAPGRLYSMRLPSFDRLIQRDFLRCRLKPCLTLGVEAGDAVLVDPVRRLSRPLVMRDTTPERYSPSCPVPDAVRHPTVLVFGFTSAPVCSLFRTIRRLAVQRQPPLFISATFTLSIWYQSMVAFSASC